jgi:hypothetical protein
VIYLRAFCRAVFLADFLPGHHIRWSWNKSATVVAVNATLD